MEHFSDWTLQGLDLVFPNLKLDSKKKNFIVIVYPTLLISLDLT